MISCIAVDDEPLALEVIQQFCAKIHFINLIKTFSSTKEALLFIKKNNIDLLFLDIRMPDMNGIDFFRSIDDPPLLILTTAYAEFAVEGFNIKAVDFLLKPMNFKRFEEAVLKVKENLDRFEHPSKEDNRSLLVRSEYSLVKIPFSKILYIETLDDYIKIHQAGIKPVLTISSIKKILEKLPANEFLRVHRSFVVSASHIESIRGKIISLGIVDIPIGKNYEAEFFKAYMRDSF